MLSMALAFRDDTGCQLTAMANATGVQEVECLYAVCDSLSAHAPWHAIIPTGSGILKDARPANFR